MREALTLLINVLAVLPSSSEFVGQMVILLWALAAFPSLTALKTAGFQIRLNLCEAVTLAERCFELNSSITTLTFPQ